MQSASSCVASHEGACWCPLPSLCTRLQSHNEEAQRPVGVMASSFSLLKLQCERPLIAELVFQNAGPGNTVF